MQIPSCFLFLFFCSRANEQTQWTESANKQDDDMRTRRKQTASAVEKKCGAQKNNRHNSIPSRTKPYFTSIRVFLRRVLRGFFRVCVPRQVLSLHFFAVAVSVCCHLPFSFSFFLFLFDSKLGRKDWCWLWRVCVCALGNAQKRLRKGKKKTENTNVIIQIEKIQFCQIYEMRARIRVCVRMYTVCVHVTRAQPTIRRLQTPALHWMMFNFHLHGPNSYVQYASSFCQLMTTRKLIGKVQHLQISSIFPPFLPCRWRRTIETMCYVLPRLDERQVSFTSFVERSITLMNGMIKNVMRWPPSIIIIIWGWGDARTGTYRGK